MRRFFFHVVARVAVLALFTAISARAALVAYEGFDYANSTTIGGQTGGIGWTNSWAAGSSASLATNATGSLGYTDANGQALQTTGGSLVVGNPIGTTAVNANPNRLLPSNLSGGAGTTAGSGGTRWISFLFKRLNFATGALPYLRQANFGLFEGSGERVNIGGPNTSTTVSNVLSAWSGSGLHNQAAPYQSANHPITSGSTYFILVKVVSDGTAATDSAYVWFNWTNLLVEPDITTANLVESEMNLSSVNTMRFQAGNQNASGSNAVFQVDELRVGTTFDDVTPEVVSASQPPSITSQPDDQTVIIGDPVTFTVNVDGSAPFHYQWYFNTNSLLIDQTNASLTIAAAQTNIAGGYSVIITNGINPAATSIVAKLKVNPLVPPAITNQPKDFTNVVGLTATFKIVATGSAPLRYQWYFNSSSMLPNQTNASLTFAIASTNDAGGYSVIATNSGGATTSLVATLTVIPASPALLPAFPGADGAAKYASGGRKGIVYHVTKLDRNLNDAVAGTLRYGLTDGNFPPGVPRTIVFDVAGVFWLGQHGAERPEFDNGWDTQSRYNLSGNTTIAGQTAPGPVIIMGGVTKAGSINTVVRNVMFAPGYGMKSFKEPDHVPPIVPTPGDFPDSVVYDALDISGQNIILDHLTAIYATDETISCNELAANLTVQYCNIALGENYPQEDAEGGTYATHSLGSLLQAGSNAKISIINNLYAHLKGRVPRVGSEIGTGALNDFRNNVFYNWYNTAGTGASGQPSFNNFINNFYLAGPGGDDFTGTHITNATVYARAGGTGIFNGSDASATRAFVSGNLKDTNKDGDPNDAAAATIANSSFSSLTEAGAAYDVSIGLTLSASDGFTNVLRHAGSRWWNRDYIFTLGNTGAITINDIAAYMDERLIHEIVTGTGKIVAWADNPFDSSPDEGVEWRSLLAMRADPNTFSAPFNHPAGWDTDGDGMPDTWEIEHGLNPGAANNNADFDNDGYSDLEEYLNEIAAWPAPGVIIFAGTTNSRYAEIFNWQVNGQQVNIAGKGIVTTFTLWQPSHYDTAIVSNLTTVVDAVGQHAGILRLTHNATLNITNGWLKVADKLDIGTGCTADVKLSGRLDVATNLVNHGTLRLTGQSTLNVSGTFINNGLLDIMTWSGTLPPGFMNNGTVLDRSLIQVSSAVVNGLNFEANTEGYAGHNYQLQYRDDLASGGWQNAGLSIPGTGSLITLTHNGGAAGGQRFYRIAVDP